MGINTNIIIEGVNFTFYQVKNGSFTETRRINELNMYDEWVDVNVTVVGFTNEIYAQDWQKAKFKDTRSVSLSFKKTDSENTTLQEIYIKVYTELLKLDEFEGAEIIL